MASSKDKWPFDPMQPGDHEPVRIPDDHPSKQQPPKPEGEERKE